MGTNEHLKKLLKALEADMYGVDHPYTNLLYFLHKIGIKEAGKYPTMMIESLHRTLGG